ncbi:MAG: Zn-ribbon containing protein [Candidatus Thermoplasmatota archaeon]|nr:Zn-ribbon containing protein [Candidatus Thermoplasmatota archaeon]
MPHQCLKCGESFPEGSSNILKGCPFCGGTRFFFTERPLGKEEREKLTELASKDIKFLVRDILTKEPRIAEKAVREEWLQYEPEKRRGEVIEAKERRILGVKKVKKQRAKREVEKLVPKIIRKKSAGDEVIKQPEVVNILESGVYEIDVESLLERSPVIVRKDGTYLIHLPSLFEKLLARK